ncbi:hypothetical protein [Streptomyces sp. NPDC048644]|uniref:hypothetical protein n=1 Tax=Streptomyces sp. NPDC048644 TaxID=3365582 RepID=UPI003712C42C
MHHDYDVMLMEGFAEVFGDHTDQWPASAALSVPYLDIVFRCLESEYEDDDEVEEFLRRAAAAHRAEGARLFPALNFATRLAASLPPWWSEDSARSERRYSAWEAMTAVHRIVERDGQGDFGRCITAALTTYEIVLEGRRRANTEAFTARMRALRASRTSQAASSS